MKILRFEISRYTDGHPSSFYKVFIEDPKDTTKEKFWGTMAIDEVHAVIDYERRKYGNN